MCVPSPPSSPLLHFRYSSESSSPPPIVLLHLLSSPHLASPLSVDVTAVPPAARGAAGKLQCIVGHRQPQVTKAVTKRDWRGGEGEGGGVCRKDITRGGRGQMEGKGGQETVALQVALARTELFHMHIPT